MISLRAYQLDAVDALVACRRGILKAPAGSGKTIILAAALAELIRRVGPLKVAWVANTTEQCEQARAALSHFDETRQPAILICCYQGCPNLAGFDLVILDECHHLPAPEYRKILDGHSGRRWGMSATPERADDLRDDVFRLIGPIVHVVHRQQLEDAGQLASAKVFIHSPNFKDEMSRQIDAAALPEFEKRKRRWPFLFQNEKSAQEQMNRIIFQSALEIGIKNNLKRNVRIVELARENAERSTLILIQTIEHGKLLQSRIPGAELVFSKMGAKRRREAIRRFSDGELKCMIATSLADEGMDVPRAEVLILASAGRSAAKVEQRTGRVLRAFRDKTHGTIHDFSDIHHYFLAAQARRRVSVYRKLNYQIFEHDL